MHYGPQTDIYTSQRPTNTLMHLCTHKQLWPHPDALYLGVLDEPCLYKSDKPLPESQTLSRTLRAKQRREKAAISAVKNVSFMCWKGFVSWCIWWHAAWLRIAQIKSGVYICYTHAKPHFWLYTDCLERGIYFLFPRWRHSGCELSNICFCVHKH